ncbi:type IV pilus biogenesis/stability protein PilW [Alkalimarinus sediminis]|uniref:Type IV pilus biogenesis/stability protein PilW n=1 Tax=Alkalimarinus sediminis TaxID=1632866 RepID=A0A9E8HSU4_9ALTE|nr:type IV pilus biogenesis/stability protein PilW [Alkalimarinus sediminis]UZW75896.1 type IV pilus biogenesis/stability protein PilW [Alkalimarinus sediminis]
MKFFLIGFLALIVSGCVTTTDSPFSNKADEGKALQNYIQLGLAYIQRNDFEKARTNIGRALEIDSDSSEAYAALGLLYQQQAENDLAEEHFKQAMSLDANNTRGRTFYASFLFRQERYQESLQQFELAGRDTGYSRRAVIFINIAQCHLKLGQNDQAVKAYEKALALDRVQPQALIGISQLLIQQGEFLKGQQYYNRMVNVIKSSGMTHSAKSLWLGIELARHFNDQSKESSYALLLKKLYPESQEYQQYRALKSND